MAATNAAKRSKPDLKVVILGASAVGKTCLISRYINGTFDNECLETIGASFFLKQWGPKNMAIWDTAGQERFSGLSSFYCRDAGAAILAFDLTSTVSFQELRSRFLPLLADEPNCLKVVVGTKSDCVDDDSDNTHRGTSKEACRSFAMEINEGLLAKQPGLSCPYFETSSKTNIGVDNVFTYIFETKFGKLPVEYSQSGGYKREQSATSESKRNTIKLHDSSPAQSEPKRKCC